MENLLDDLNENSNTLEFADDDIDNDNDGLQLLDDNSRRCRRNRVLIIVLLALLAAVIVTAGVAVPLLLRRNASTTTSAATTSDTAVVSASSSSQGTTTGKGKGRHHHHDQHPYDDENTVDNHGGYYHHHGHAHGGPSTPISSVTPPAPTSMPTFLLAKNAPTVVVLMDDDGTMSTTTFGEDLLDSILFTHPTSMMGAVVITGFPAGSTLLYTDATTENDVTVDVVDSAFRLEWNYDLAALFRTMASLRFQPPPGDAAAFAFDLTVAIAHRNDPTAQQTLTVPVRVGSLPDQGLVFEVTVITSSTTALQIPVGARVVGSSSSGLSSLQLVVAHDDTGEPIGTIQLADASSTGDVTLQDLGRGVYVASASKEIALLALLSGGFLFQPNVVMGTFVNGIVVSAPRDADNGANNDMVSFAVTIQSSTNNTATPATPPMPIAAATAVPVATPTVPTPTTTVAPVEQPTAVPAPVIPTAVPMAPATVPTPTATPLMLPTANTTTPFSVTFVEGMEMPIGREIVVILMQNAITAVANVAISGFPPDTILTYHDVNGTIFTEHDVPDPLVFDDTNFAVLIQRLESLMVISNATTNSYPLTIMVTNDDEAVASQSFSLIVTITARGPMVDVEDLSVAQDASAPLAIYPNFDSGIGGSESLKFEFSVALDQSGTPIGSLQARDGFLIGGVQFKDQGGGHYVLDSSSGTAGERQQSLALFLVTGSLIFTPRSDASGVFAEGIEVRVDVSEAGSGDDVTSTFIVVSIIDTDTQSPSLRPSLLHPSPIAPTATSGPPYYLPPTHSPSINDFSGDATPSSAEPTKEPTRSGVLPPFITQLFSPPSSTEPTMFPTLINSPTLTPLMGKTANKTDVETSSPTSAPSSSSPSSTVEEITSPTPTAQSLTPTGMPSFISATPSTIPTPVHSSLSPSATPSSVAPSQLPTAAPSEATGSQAPSSSQDVLQIAPSSSPVLSNAALATEAPTFLQAGLAVLDSVDVVRGVPIVLGMRILAVVQSTQPSSIGAILLRGFPASGASVVYKDTTGQMVVTNTRGGTLRVRFGDVDIKERLSRLSSVIFTTNNSVGDDFVLEIVVEHADDPSVTATLSLQVHITNN